MSALFGLVAAQALLLVAQPAAGAEPTAAHPDRGVTRIDSGASAELARRSTISSPEARPAGAEVLLDGEVVWLGPQAARHPVVGALAGDRRRRRRDRLLPAASS